MADNGNVFCVIMAGGVGSRFWPMSRNDRPKQFLDILGTGQSLIQQTFRRVTMFCPPENVYVVTGEAYRDQVAEHLPQLHGSQILLEPMRKNTAPCIAYANQVIGRRNPQATVVVAPSDHLILDEPGYAHTIRTALAFAATSDSLITIGINPSRPETGYGYIQINGKAEGGIPSLYKVKTFTEKPNLEMARIFLESGEFFWNSGVFIWSLPSIARAFQQHLPQMGTAFQEVRSSLGTPQEREALASVYAECKSVSIDYGIMEKATNVYVLCAEFGWSDLGTWGSLYQYAPKDPGHNAVLGGNVMTYGVKNSLISVPGDKLVVVQGLEGIILVESDGVIMICRMEGEQEIKGIVNDVMIEKGDRFL